MNMMTIHSRLPEVVMPRCQTQHWLRGQTALVTGAGTGIGKEIALALAAYGADVAVNYVSGDETARQVTEAIRETGNRSIAIKADVSNEEQVQAMFKRLFEEFGTIDILVNNAGLQQDAPFEELTLAQWNKVISVNLTGQFLCARGGAGVQAPWGPTRDLVRGGEDRLHQLRTRGDPLGRSCKLRGLEGWGDAHDEEHRTRGRALSHPRQQHLPRRDPHPHQHAGVVDARGLQRADEAHPLQAHRRARRDRTGGGVARLGLCRLYHGGLSLRRWGHDPVSRLRDGRLVPLPRNSYTLSCGFARTNTLG
jgi:hypothetical protein